MKKRYYIIFVLLALIGCTTHIHTIDVQITEPLPDFISGISALTPEQSNTTDPSICLYIDEKALLDLVDNRGDVTGNFAERTRLTIDNIALSPDSNSNSLALAHGIFDDDGERIGYYSDIILMCYALFAVDAGSYELTLTTPDAQGNTFEYSWGITVTTIPTLYR